MPSIKDKTTVDAIAREYCSNGRDKAQAMRTIGYAESCCKSGKAVGCVYGNVRIKDAIARIDAKITEEQGVTIKTIDNMYTSAYAMAQQTKNASAMATAATGRARLYGMDKDAHDDKQAEQLSQAQEREARRLATIRLLGNG